MGFQSDYILRLIELMSARAAAREALAEYETAEQDRERAQALFEAAGER
ncbi:MAG: hypothetical protein U1F44_00420 [Coriobacteriia bacterium]|nr:hypothetical protein [Coriobacteriia bacterium]